MQHNNKAFEITEVPFVASTIRQAALTVNMDVKDWRDDFQPSEMEA